MRFRLFLGFLTVLAAFSGSAAARGTLDSILPEIRSAHPGRLSDAEPWTDSEGRTHYKIKWLTPEGRVLYFNADADSGRYSNSGGDAGERGDRGDRSDGIRRARGEHDGDSASDDNGGSHRSHWNGGDGDWNGGGTGGSTGGADWHRRDGGQGGGDWRGGGDRGGAGADTGWGRHRHHGDN